MRPGDCIVGDQDGVVVVPAAKAEMVYSIAHGREVIEEIVKEELTKNPGPPGRFYPFMSGKIKVDSPLGKLIRPLIDNMERLLRGSTNPAGSSCTTIAPARLAWYPAHTLRTRFGPH